MLLRFLILSLLLLVTLSGFSSSQKYAIVFDKGGVLTRRDRSQAYRFIQETLRLSKNEFENAHALQQSQKIPEAQFWKDYVERGRCEVSKNWPTLLEGLFQLSSIPDIDTLVLIEKLSLKNHLIGMLSNTSEKKAEFSRIVGYYVYFTPCLLSYELGVEKPDHRSFEILIRALDLPPENIIFIDDSIQNIEAAKELGIDAILFTDAESLRHELSKRGLLSD